MKSHITAVLRRPMILLIFMAVACPAWSAPVVVVPGDGAGYVYYSAGGGSAPATPVEDDSNVGMVAAFFFTPPTDTWVVCNGQTISAATYPKLVKALTGSDTAVSAVMPNLQGYFLRGANTGASGVDPGRTIGSAQADENKSHNHAGTTANSPAVSSSTSTDGAHSHTSYYGPSGPYTGISVGAASVLITLTNSAGAHAHTVTLPAHNHTFTTGSSGGAETRPVNIAVIYAMRAK